MAVYNAATVDVHGLCWSSIAATFMSCRCWLGGGGGKKKTRVLSLDLHAVAGLQLPNIPILKNQLSSPPLCDKQGSQTLTVVVW